MIDWSKPVELEDGTPLVRAHPDYGYPDEHGDYILRREDGVCFTFEQSKFLCVKYVIYKNDGRNFFYDSAMSARNRAEVVSEAVEVIADQQETQDYSRLREILDKAFDQAATGKGKERHENSLAWHEQPILTIGHMTGPGFAVGQSIKKQGEALGMLERGQVDAALAEILGAIVYAAGAYELIRQTRKDIEGA